MSHYSRQLQNFIESVEPSTDAERSYAEAAFAGTLRAEQARFADAAEALASNLGITLDDQAVNNAAAKLKSLGINIQA